MYPDDHPDIQFIDPDTRFDYHEATSMIERYSAFEDLLNANSAKGLVMPGSRTVPLETPGPVAFKRRTPTRAAITLSDPEAKKERLVLAALPAFNEEKTIAKVIIKAQKHVHEVLVVDDGSTDSTAEIAKALGAIVISHSSNRGYGAALQTIFDVARKLDADTLVILDSDGQHDPEQIPALLKPLREGMDVVIGSRFIGNNGNHIPAYRIVGMMILDKATNIAGNLEVSDTQSGFRAYGKNAIATIKVSGNGMSAGSEILFQAQDHHFSVAEVPISVKYDVEKPSTQNPISHGLSVLGTIVGLVGYRRPLISFGVPGFILTFIGCIAFLISVTELVTGGPFHSIMFIGGITFLILGLLLMTTSLILNGLIQIVKME